ncbi:prolipoprotein diacylglyceryl transferase [Filimonas lacunae]|uniref:Prolipoprotein diacylglyceryl transferase n=1 Tax=Filimonas lacunae TaxID=477680 RepID=A0A173MFI6_9BACT|nr:prolipoprotein diacylglyceryl transferase family protein [Filimonas lacunae]BAV06345.1 prolipoprotein diacylglyceryl transferase [Filimonas lacunae]SIT26555.1 prolipoprotein diacylglyceryl transferase [Filimonas lacunae]
MYPNLYYLFKELFGISIPALKIVNSFGFFVAIAFFISAWVLMKELKRKEKEGLLSYEDTKVIVGKPASAGELLVNFLLGFVFGYKILGVLFDANGLKDPQAYIFSGQGSILAGLGLGLFFAGLKWYDKNKAKLPQPQETNIRIWPSDRVGDITIIAFVAGFIGAKLFDNFENWDRFVQDVWGNLFSPSGLTFYGGLIFATIAIVWYLRKHQVNIIHAADAFGPVLMLSYGLGRVGCQVSGDGDWGIVNLKPKPFSWIPDWAWAYDYAHNVNKEGVPLLNCTWDDYCTHLPQPVYPTPLYEIIMSLALFGLLWYFRKKLKVAGRVFALYLFVNGLERFMIEKIRVNTKQHVLGFNPTQAEIISSLLMIAGIALFLLAPKLQNSKFFNAPPKKQAAA